MELSRKPRALEITGERHARFQDRIRRGLMVPPVKLGRCSYWPTDELTTINAALVAGASEEELRIIVAQLVAARRQAMPKAA